MYQTLELIPGDESKPTKTYRQSIVRVGQGVEERSPDGINAAIVEWDAICPALAPDIAERVHLFLKGCGGAIPFYWSFRPGLWTCSSWEINFISVNARSFNGKFVQFF